MKKLIKQHRQAMEQIALSYGDEADLWQAKADAILDRIIEMECEK